MTPVILRYFSGTPIPCLFDSPPHTPPTVKHRKVLIRCKFMCYSQHFTIYLLSLQNILLFDRSRAYVILLIYMLDWNSLLYTSRLNDISRLSFWKNEQLPRKHMLIDFINENEIFLQIHVIVTLVFSWFFFSCKSFLLGVNKISCIHGSFLLSPTLPEGVKFPFSTWITRSLQRCK